MCVIRVDISEYYRARHVREETVRCIERLLGVPWALGGRIKRLFGALPVVLHC